MGEFDFMKEVNEFCIGCRFIQDDRCVCPNSEFYSIEVTDDEIDFSSCSEKFDEIDSKNFRNYDDESGSLL